MLGLALNSLIPKAPSSLLTISRAMKSGPAHAWRQFCPNFVKDSFFYPSTTKTVAIS